MVGHHSTMLGHHSIILVLWIRSVWWIQSEKRDLWGEKWQHESQITRIRNFIIFQTDRCFYTSFLRGHIRKCEIISLTFWHILEMWDLHISHILRNVSLKPSHFWSFFQGVILDLWEGFVRRVVSKPSKNHHFHGVGSCDSSSWSENTSLPETSEGSQNSSL